MRNSKTRWQALGAIGLAACVVIAHAQEYPTRPLRLIVPFPPGGGTDLVARQLAQRLAGELGQPVVADNRGGANGIVGAQQAANAAPDGYTLLLAASSVLVFNPILYSKISYDPVRSFAPVTLLTKQPMLVAINLDLPARNLQEFLAYARSRPGQLNFAGAGTATSMPVYQLNRLAGVTMQEIPYAGGGPALAALLAGHVQMMTFSLGTHYPQVQAGKIRGIAVTSLTRSAIAPELPTVAESGFPGFEAGSWNGLVAPAGTPREIVDRLHRAALAAMSQPDLRELFGKQGIEIVTSTPAEFGRFARDELQRWQKVAQDAGIRPQ